jgi:hypothetical protein
MKFLVLVGMLFVGSAFATEQVAAPKAACKPSECFAVGFKAFEAGKHHEAMPILEPMCNKDDNASACHLVGIMYNFNKTDKDAKSKSTAALKKACEKLKYKQACDDLKKF